MNKYFNPRSRVGNDSARRGYSQSCAEFQSTFPRGERLYEMIGKALARKISIHVPAWGTTMIPEKCFWRMAFQSTFPRGERLNQVPGLHTIKKFQSTFPRGERQDSLYCAVILCNISIHVPAWGTTVSSIFSVLPGSYFNPRSRVGNDY